MTNKTAIFFGKFQPPHLGHVITIKRLLPNFKKLIIGITYVKSKNSILKPKQIKKILKEIFQDYNNISFELIEGSIEEGTASISHLNFDIIISGNNKILNVLKTMGYKTLFQPRSIGVGFSGSEIRNLSNQKTNKKIKRNIEFKFELEKLSNLKPLEKVLPNHLANIEQMILKDGIMLKPIIIDNKHNIVLDGSHRYAFLLKFGYKKAPVIKVDYSDESIFVGNYLKHRYLIDKDLKLNKSEIVKAALNEKLLDARTTRHFFPFRKINYPVKLSKLVRGKLKNIEFLIEKTNIKKEINKNLQYIDEINTELKILNNYIDEQRDIKNYLIYQVDLMKKSKKFN
jgi:cytidyltransferase-like protein